MYDFFYNWSDAEWINGESDRFALVGSTAVDGILRLAWTVWSLMDTTVRFLAMRTGVQNSVAALTTTVMACLAWYYVEKVSDLSSVKDLQCRLDRRRCRQKSMQIQRQLLAVIFLCGMSNAHAMEGQSQPGTQEAFFQRMSAMAEAATCAAAAAEEALRRSNPGGGSANDGLQAASRILKPPDTFNGDDVMQFQQWKHQFTSWLCFGDGRYSEILDILEKKGKRPHGQATMWMSA
eukprot:s2915_g17.t1